MWGMKDRKFINNKRQLAFNICRLYYPHLTGEEIGLKAVYRWGKGSGELWGQRTKSWECCLHTLRTPEKWSYPGKERRHWCFWYSLSWIPRKAWALPWRTGKWGRKVIVNKFLCSVDQLVSVVKQVYLPLEIASFSICLLLSLPWVQGET